MPGCVGNDCLSPGVAYTKTGEVCAGGAGTETGKTPPDYGNLYGANCSAQDKTGAVPFSADAAMYHIRRSPACGPWTSTTDPAAAFSYQGTPLCYPLTGPNGAISTYDPTTKACLAGGLGATDWRLIADDQVPGTG